MRTKLYLALLIISLSFMMLLVTPPAYADNNSSLLPPVPVTPPANGQLPGYRPVHTTPQRMTRASIIAHIMAGGTGVPAKAKAMYPVNVCPAITLASGLPTGIATVTGGQLIQDFTTGDLWFYNTATKACTLIQIAPAGVAVDTSVGLAVQGSLVVSSSFGPPAGVWTCGYNSNPKKPQCPLTSGFLALPATCPAPVTTCFPVGIAFDKSDNIWYADPLNSKEVELLGGAAHFSTVGVINTFLPTPLNPFPAPYAVTIDSAGNHYVVDGNLAVCSGDVWKNGLLLTSVGADLTAVTISTSNPSHKAHLYVAVENFCGTYSFPFVADLSTLQILPHPYNAGWDDMLGISTLLYFTDYTFALVWLTHE